MRVHGAVALTQKNLDNQMSTKPNRTKPNQTKRFHDVHAQNSDGLSRRDQIAIGKAIVGRPGKDDHWVTSSTAGWTFAAATAEFPENILRPVSFNRLREVLLRIIPGSRSCGRTRENVCSRRALSSRDSPSHILLRVPMKLVLCCWTLCNLKDTTRPDGVRIGCAVQCSDDFSHSIQSESIPEACLPDACNGQHHEIRRKPSTHIKKI